ncbi:uncharacterized protein N7483_013151 [Penicillium malachiteum]|uniref:uncharacterized protein n=1 Tax=Penicillium malachiteum TaxID=1324776 RepID=UPI0025488A87|nr:uncharacterized protein N7483_013151 [Penicillium malachiteum]KAJ5715970.1 hypothetical protein N7483_013151 [Penicillium malachiteum]
MSDVYAQNLSRDEAEAIRLDGQFDLLTENIGYLLHPEVLESLSAKSSLKVADLATGTARFLLRLVESNSFPENAILHGTDISPALFPAPAAMPPNIDLGIFDIREPVPTHLEGSYDLVHVRQVAAGLHASEWMPVMVNLTKLLKPGGALQWEECNFANVIHLRGASSACTINGARKLGTMFRSGLWEHFQHGWNRLEQGMVEAGLQNVGSEFVSSDRIPETRGALTQNGIQVILRWANAKAQAGNLQDANGKKVSVSEVQALGKQAIKDIDSGCYVRFDIHVGWGFKPNE